METNELLSFEDLIGLPGYELKTDIQWEEKASMPSYFPGDIVKTKAGGVGIITNAHGHINGLRVYWDRPQDFPRKIDHAWVPQYSLSSLRGYEPVKYLSWWMSGEWEAVLLSPLHKVIQ